jgi:uncharacterized protein (UPF0548 family)
VPVLLSRPSDDDLRRLFARLASENLTYTGPSPIIGDPHVPGYRYVDHAQQLGSGDAVFERAKDALRGWEAHRAAGAVVAPADAPLTVGTDVVVTLRLGPVHVLAPCRVVSAVDDPALFGFSYATLPGHPERGEEAFHIERSPDGGVRFRVRAVSRPALLLVQLAGPLAHVVQARATRRYLEGVRRFVSSG